jgi:hypothetical protein
MTEKGQELANIKPGVIAEFYYDFNLTDNIRLSVPFKSYP